MDHGMDEAGGYEPDPLRLRKRVLARGACHEGVRSRTRAGLRPELAILRSSPVLRGSPCDRSLGAEAGARRPQCRSIAIPVNSRGAGGDIDPGQFMSKVLNMPLDWPWKRVELGHLSHHRYRQRPLSRNVAIAELYHENSKLYAERLPELAAGLIDPEALRSEFVRRRSVGR